jgi:hypothetical protein
MGMAAVPISRREATRIAHGWSVAEPWVSEGKPFRPAGSVEFIPRRGGTSNRPSGAGLFPRAYPGLRYASPWAIFAPSLRDAYGTLTRISFLERALVVGKGFFCRAEMRTINHALQAGRCGSPVAAGVVTLLELLFCQYDPVRVG